MTKVVREKDIVAVAQRLIVDWVSPRRTCKWSRGPRAVGIEEAADRDVYENAGLC